jgi:hypothetical protein
MSALRRRCVAAVVGLALVTPLVLAAQPASAFPKGDFVFPFNYKVVASTHIKKLNQTITPPPGRFKGGIDVTQGGLLQGSITLPPVTFTFSPAAGIPLATATAQIVQAKPVIGKVTLANLHVTATATFNLRILSVVPATPTVPGVGPLPVPVPPVNLVGDQCTTEKPIVVTMTGVASLTKKSTFTGSFTIPNFKTCGALTIALNQLIPGPGNTFSATAYPS